MNEFIKHIEHKISNAVTTAHN